MLKLNTSNKFSRLIILNFNCNHCENAEIPRKIKKFKVNLFYLNIYIELYIQ